MPKELNTADQKLVQYLVEAHGKERELETALQAHIAMTTHKPYRKRLQQHLAETKRHAREVEKRVKQLGGDMSSGAVLDQVEAVQSLAMKGAALAQGPMHMLRGTGEPEKMLKNAKTEYANEAEEIATYKAIEALANAVKDKETAKVARTIRRDEEKMFSFLERQIDTLTKMVVKDEIPAAERNGASKPARKRSTSATAKKRSTSATAKKKTSSVARTRTKTTAKKPASRAKAGSSRTRTKAAKKSGARTTKARA